MDSRRREALASDGNTQRCAAPANCSRDHLGKAHAGVQAEAEGAAHHRVAHRGLESPVPARQHLGRRLDAAATWTVQPPAADASLLDRIAQIVEVEARPAVEGAEQHHRKVGLYLSDPFDDLP